MTPACVKRVAVAAPVVIETQREQCRFYHFKVAPLLVDWLCCRRVTTGDMYQSLTIFAECPSYMWTRPCISTTLLLWSDPNTSLPAWPGAV